MKASLVRVGLAAALAVACTPKHTDDPRKDPDDPKPSWPALEGRDLALLAGSAEGSGTIDGTGAAARFTLPRAIARDAQGNLFVADTAASTIRRITAAGVVTTFAGRAYESGSTNGPAADARFNGPVGLAFDTVGNLFVADSGANTIRKIATDGTVSTLAGKAGERGADDGAGEAARFELPTGLAIDAEGSLYVADVNNGTIRVVTSAGVVTTLAGKAGEFGADDGVGEAARFMFPEALAIDDADGTLYVADSGNQLIRKVATKGEAKGTVTTLAGRAGEQGTDDGAATEARFSGPRSITLGADGHLYVSDMFSNTIRRVTREGVVSTLAGRKDEAGSEDGELARFSQPMCVLAAGPETAVELFVCDGGNSTIRRIANAKVTTFAGSAPRLGSQDGTGRDAAFTNPVGMTFDADGSVLVADWATHTLRRITREGVVTTWAGAAGEAGLSDGARADARFAGASHLVRAPDGTVFVSDSDNHRIRKIAPDGTVSIYAGTSGGRGGGGWADGPALEAMFEAPQGLALDAHGNLFVADTRNQRIRKISKDGIVSTIAGTGLPGAADGRGEEAEFHFPQALAFDAQGRLVVTDMMNHLLRVIDLSGSEPVVSTLAGTRPIDGLDPVPGYVDGKGGLARFNRPLGIAREASGALLVADTSNGVIRRVTAAGEVTTVAGTPGVSGLVEGALPGSIPEPQALLVAEDGVVVFSFTGGIGLARIR